DDPVVKDILHVGLGGQAAHGLGVACRGSVTMVSTDNICRVEGLNSSYPQMLIAAKETSPGNSSGCFGIYRNGAVAIDDDIAVWSNGSCRNLGIKKGRNKWQEQEHDGRLEMMPPAASSRSREGRVRMDRLDSDGTGHRRTSVLY